MGSLFYMTNVGAQKKARDTVYDMSDMLTFIMQIVSGLQLFCRWGHFRYRLGNKITELYESNLSNYFLPQESSNGNTAARDYMI